MRIYSVKREVRSQENIYVGMGARTSKVLAAIDGTSKCGVPRLIPWILYRLGATNLTSPLFEDMHDLRITVLKEPKGTPLPPDAALLVSR
jgi:hypothetical protein